tara:strand:- start:558 stop:731 length:174 start_codon:yes stop_codon:yes gene_type:complete
MIESVTYLKDPLDSTINASLIMVEDGITSSVPLDPNNRNYREIQEWVAEGNTIEEPE